MPKPQKAPTTRMNLDVGQKARARLEQLADETEQSFSEVIRNALSLYDLMVSETKRGNSLIIRGAEGEKEIVIPGLLPVQS